MKMSFYKNSTSRPERIRYRHLTPEEREIICNGCGPKGGIIPVPEFVYTEACNHHDFNYWIGANKLQRKKADLQFLAEMIAEAAGVRKYIILARIYYRAVRWFGGLCFNYAKKQRTKSDLKREIMKNRIKAKVKEKRA
jgi:hypothetical protein